MSGLGSARSLLFVPADDERKVRHALRSGADGIILDLEDAVEAGQKDEARILGARLLREVESPSLRLVRINRGERRDLEFLRSVEVDAIVLPKATPAAVAELGLDGPPVVALIETALGLRSAFETAKSGRVQALMLGSVDLGAELGLQPRRDGLELYAARSQLVIDSAAAGLRAPFDGVYVRVRDLEGLKAEIALVRSLGFGGKACIHPAQLEPVAQGFRASAEEVAWAHDVLAAYAHAVRAGRGVAVLDEAMIDAPVVRRAQEILKRDGRSG